MPAARAQIRSARNGRSRKAALSGAGIVRGSINFLDGISETISFIVGDVAGSRAGSERKAG